MKTRITSFILAFALMIGSLGIFSTTAYASSRATTGRSTVSQTVYSGPDSGDYASVGSIDPTDTIYILGKVKNMDWYHIQYTITQGSNAGKEKAGYVPSSTINNISGATIQEEIYNGGLRISVNSYKVYSCDDSSLSIQTGSISANESITLLYAYQYSDSSKSYLVAYIEYSTSNGAKRGYVYYPEFIENIVGTNGVTSVARVKQTVNVYYGYGSDYGIAGTISENEFVSVIAKKWDTVYVEYNSNSGRKRGHISSTYLDYHRPGLTYIDVYGFDTNVQPDGGFDITHNVYAGPTHSHALLGEVTPNDIVHYQAFHDPTTHISFIIYTTRSDGVKRSGWIVP